MSEERERPKKSWREIDAQREKSGHRKEGGTPKNQERLERSAAYRSYKTQLNKLFEGGGVPDALKQKLNDAGVGQVPEGQREAEEAIVSAKTPKEAMAALETCRQQFGFPRNEQVLAKLLDVGTIGVVIETANQLVALINEGAIKRATSLRARVQTALMTHDGPKAQDALKQLLAKI